MAIRSLPVFLCLLITLFLQCAAAQDIPPWSTQTMFWGWQSDINQTWTQCRSLTLQWSQQTGKLPTPTGPYALTFFLEGNEPLVVDLGQGTLDDAGHLTEEWTVVVPTGGPYQVMLTDANGASGGVIQAMNIVGENPPVTPCQPLALTPSALQFKTSDSLNQCDTVDVSVTGGSPPYTFTAVQQGIIAKVAKYASGNFQYVLDSAAGRNLTFSVSDSSGKSATGPIFSVGVSTNSTCLTEAKTLAIGDPALTSVYPGATFAADHGSTTRHSISGGGVAGIVVAAIAALLVGAAFGACWYRRQTAQRQPQVDLEQSNTPAGEPVTVLDPPRPFILEHVPEMAGYTQFVPYDAGNGPRVVSVYDPNEASPPYQPSEPTNIPSRTSASEKPLPRISYASQSTSSLLPGTQTASRSTSQSDIGMKNARLPMNR